MGELHERQAKEILEGTHISAQLSIDILNAESKMNLVEGWEGDESESDKCGKGNVCSTNYSRFF